MSDTRKYMRELGAKIRAERTELGLQQSDLAVALGCSVSTVSDYERGVAMMSAFTKQCVFSYLRRTRSNRPPMPSALEPKAVTA